MTTRSLSWILCLQARTRTFCYSLDASPTVQNDRILNCGTRLIVADLLA
ncbi:MAG: hypothetical protein JNM43_16865 [Planctomycetaceae bacterium]|nr:hypothetical protein [Planctomycetaceae bacterium]